MHRPSVRNLDCRAAGGYAAPAADPLRARAAAVQAASTRLEQRLALYDAQLLPRLRQLAQASQAAFQHDAGDFDPVLQAHLSELEARQTRLNLQAELARWQAEGRYLSGVDELAAEGGS